MDISDTNTFIFDAISAHGHKSTFTHIVVQLQGTMCACANPN